MNGCRKLEITDEAGVSFPVLVMYPSADKEQAVRMGPHTLNVAMDGTIAEGEYPLVVISHGSGGSHLVYRTLAAHLVENGFVVAMPEHPGNNRNNNELQGKAANLEARPRHLRLVIDRLHADDAIGKRLRADAAAIVGHSMGGYTALAVAGGKPMAFVHEVAAGQEREITVTADDRVKALVLLAPAVAWFMAPGALTEVRVPILMLTAEHDQHTPMGHAEILKNGLADASLLEHRVVKGAGHYSFLSPFPAAMANPGFAPSQDPPGFDREAFHREMHTEVLLFLRRTIG